MLKSVAKTMLKNLVHGIENEKSATELGKMKAIAGGLLELINAKIAGADTIGIKRKLNSNIEQI